MSDHHHTPLEQLCSVLWEPALLVILSARRWLRVVWSESLAVVGGCLLDAAGASRKSPASQRSNANQVKSRSQIRQVY